MFIISVGVNSYILKCESSTWWKHFRLCSTLTVDTYSIHMYKMETIRKCPTPEMYSNRHIQADNLNDALNSFI